MPTKKYVPLKFNWKIRLPPPKLLFPEYERFNFERILLLPHEKELFTVKAEAGYKYIKFIFPEDEINFNLVLTIKQGSKIKGSQDKKNPKKIKFDIKIKPSKEIEAEFDMILITSQNEEIKNQNDKNKVEILCKDGSVVVNRLNLYSQSSFFAGCSCKLLRARTVEKYLMNIIANYVDSGILFSHQYDKDILEKVLDLAVRFHLGHLIEECQIALRALQ